MSLELFFFGFHLAALESGLDGLAHAETHAPAAVKHASGNLRLQRAYYSITAPT
jgi:hypothetical protein